MDEPIRDHIVVGAIEPATEAGRLWHQEWHSGEEYHGAPTECGTAGCGFLGRILAVEREAAQPSEPGLEVEQLARGHDTGGARVNDKLRKAAQAVVDPNRYARCNGEGHEACLLLVGPPDNQRVVPTERGTPSCIWNVAAMYGPGAADRQALRAALATQPSEPGIVCLCGDVFTSTEAMAEHLWLAHGHEVPSNAALPIAEEEWHAHDGLGSHPSRQHHRASDYGGTR